MITKPPAMVLLGETFPFSFQQVQLRLEQPRPPKDDMIWEPYISRQEEEDRHRAATAVTKRVNMAGVGALSRRLMAMERARVLGRTPVDHRVWALELEAKRWTAEGLRTKKLKAGGVSRRGVR